MAALGSEMESAGLILALPPPPLDGDPEWCALSQTGKSCSIAAAAAALQLSVHVRVADGVCEPMLRRGVSLPARGSRIFTTTRDDQMVARLELYVGERSFCSGNRYLGLMELSPLPTPSYRSFVQIEVLVEATADGMINCRAAEVESRALGDPYCQAEWQGELLLAGGPPPETNAAGGTDVAIFSHALAKHLPVLLATRSVRLHSGKDVIIRQHQRREEERVGTGGVLWESAIVLADYVGRNSKAFQWKGKRVLELGAGTGLVAIALALEGASVWATDGNRKVLEGAKQNVDAAGPYPDGLVELEIFDWNSAADLAKVKSAGPWDVVLGSDLVYPGNAGRKCVASNEDRPPADETLLSLLAHLCGETTTIILALKDRTGEVARFQSLVDSKAWIVSRAAPDSIMPEFRDMTQLAVLHLRKAVT